MDTSNEIKLQEEYIKKVKKINQDKNLKYTILTMGCQLNENDSEKLCGMLEKMGYTKTEKQNDADLSLFNTCCVRENAEDKLFGKLGELKRLKEQKGIIIAIGGCMMQEKHITDKIKESYPFVDILFGTHTLHKFPEDLYNAVLAVSSLVVTERHEHSNKVPYVQKGKDAAVAYGSYDFKFRNNSGHDIKITCSTDGKNVTTTLISLQ